MSWLKTYQMLLKMLLHFHFSGSKDSLNYLTSFEYNSFEISQNSLYEIYFTQQNFGSFCFCG